MKTINEIINQEPVFLNDWKDSGKFGVVADFENVYITKKEYEADECSYANLDWWHKKKIK